MFLPTGRQGRPRLAPHGLAAGRTSDSGRPTASVGDHRSTRGRGQRSQDWLPHHGHSPARTGARPSELHWWAAYRADPMSSEAGQARFRGNVPVSDCSVIGTRHNPQSIMRKAHSFCRPEEGGVRDRQLTRQLTWHEGFKSAVQVCVCVRPPH